jgi:hypothetical protein
MSSRHAHWTTGTSESPYAFAIRYGGMVLTPLGHEIEVDADEGRTKLDNQFLRCRDQERARLDPRQINPLPARDVQASTAIT